MPKSFEPAQAIKMLEAGSVSNRKETESAKHEVQTCPATLNLDEAAHFLKIHKCTASDLAATGRLPGAKIGRAWVFLLTDLETWLQEEVIRQQKSRIERYKPSNYQIITASEKRRRPLPRLPKLPGEV